MANLRGFSGVLTAAQLADHLAAMGGGFVADGPGQLQGTVVAAGTRQIQGSAGKGRAGGGRLEVSSPETWPSADANPNSAGSTPRVDAAVWRLDFAAGTATPVWVKGSTSSLGNPPAIAAAGASYDPLKINRTPGVKYDALVGYANMRGGGGAIAAADWFPTTPWGGVAGPLVIPQGSYFSSVDVPVGGLLAAGDPAAVTYRKLSAGFQVVGGVCSVRAATNQNTTNGGAPLAFDTLERNTLGAIFVPVSTTVRVGTAGDYLVSGGWTLPGATTSKFLDAYAVRNGAYVAAGQRVLIPRPLANPLSNPPSDGQPPGIPISVALPPRLVTCAANDTLGLWAYTDGSAQGVVADGSLNAWLTVQGVG